MLAPRLRALRVASPTLYRGRAGRLGAALRGGPLEGEAGALVGAASGGVRWVLRVEGLVVLVAAVVAYAQLGAGWGAFAMLFLLPDLSFLGYLAGPRVGAAAYNTAHSYIGPVAMLVIASLGDAPVAMAAGLIWCAHIGFDRALGYGLKYATGFANTHLGRIGPVDPW
ncbi:DUF4260 domain-containing protein [Variovorax sp. J22P240]|uniref:DUF4260 domain-containing protein n=1 Tax=Variovorax sp. J22P240 TaxID=3053514 RepID=UPI002579159D|nr:DUF4260 domain-containing protein [Variovorax sp. J22P240]MDL9999901.1 DUF4260 domain-containing protein [Variovorax sp. J22P240]